MMRSERELKKKKNVLDPTSRRAARSLWQAWLLGAKEKGAHQNAKRDPVDTGLCDLPRSGAWRASSGLKRRQKSWMYVKGTAGAVVVVDVRRADLGSLVASKARRPE